MKYRVQLFMDSTYEVLEFNPDMDEYCDKVYQGSLSDCEVWIRLKQNNEVDF